MTLTRLAVVRPLTVLMGLLGVVIMGGVAYTFLKIDRLPPISIPFVSVSMGYTGATAQDVELLITQPIENAVSGMSGVSSITSTSSEGSSNVNVQLVDGTDRTKYWIPFPGTECYPLLITPSTAATGSYKIKYTISRVK